MKMSRICLGGVMLFGFNVIASSPVKIEITPDLSQSIYACGEEALLEISVVGEAGKKVETGELTVTLTFEAELAGETIRVPLAGNNPFTVKATSERAGFLRCDVSYINGADTVNKFAVIGFDPESITPGDEPPEDFMSFWMEEKEEALKLPLDPKIERLDRLSDDLADGYKISIANINGTRMYGYITVPKGVGPFPVYFTIPGAGAGYTGIPEEYPRDKAIGMTLNVHDFEIEPETCNAKYDELNKDGIYTLKGVEGRRSFYYFRTILGLCRGVKYLTERTDWDGQHFVVGGSSQGGAMTHAVTALNPEIVTAATFNVPAMCNFAAYKFNRQPGWPTPNADFAERYADTLKYYDGVNFAANIKCPVIYGIGLVDMLCPASTIFAAYNSVASEKTIWITPWMGHDFDPEYTTYRLSFIRENLGIEE